MSKLLVAKEFQQSLIDFLKSTKHPELISTYLFFVEQKFELQPVLFIRDKLIYQSETDAIRALEKEDKFRLVCSFFIILAVYE